MDTVISFFQPADILLLLATICGFTAFMAKGRKKMLLIKFGADITFALYLLILGGFAGAMSAGIAALGGLIQLLTPGHKMRETLKLRFVLACVLSVAGVLLLADRLTDSYPFISVVTSRFAEIFQSTLVMRLGFFISVFPWIIYNWDNGFYLAAAMNIVIATSQILGIWRNERRLPRDPVP